MNDASGTRKKPGVLHESYAQDIGRQHPVSGQSAPSMLDNGSASRNANGLQEKLSHSAWIGMRNTAEANYYGRVAIFQKSGKLQGRLPTLVFQKEKSCY